MKVQSEHTPKKLIPGDLGKKGKGKGKKRANKLNERGKLHDFNTKYHKT